MDGSGQGRWSGRRRIGAGLTGAVVLAAVALVALGAAPSGNYPPPPGGSPLPSGGYTYSSSLQLEAEGAGSGTVTAALAGSDGDGLACASAGGDESGDCADTYQWATTPPSVQLVAVAQPGSTFVAWEDGGASCGSNPTCPLTLSGNHEVKARFEPVGSPQTFALTVSTGGSGGGTVSGEGIDCRRSGSSTSGDCSQTFAPGAQVVLTAAPDASSTFSGSWGGACASSGTNPTCTVTMNAPQAVSATFTRVTPLAGACTITGTSGPNVLNGTAGADVICGKSGNDVINGRGGADTLKGDTGADVLNGGNGPDTMLGGRGGDTLRGGSGADSANGGTGVDSCTAEVKISCP